MSEKREFPILNGKLLSDLDLNGHKLIGLTIPEGGGGGGSSVEVVEPSPEGAGKAADAKAVYEGLGRKQDSLIYYWDWGEVECSVDGIEEYVDLLRPFYLAIADEWEPGHWSINEEWSVLSAKAVSVVEGLNNWNAREVVVSVVRSGTESPVETIRYHRDYIPDRIPASRELNRKQDALNDAQTAAVDSGITAEKVKKLSDVLYRYPFKEAEYDSGTVIVEPFTNSVRFADGAPFAIAVGGESGVYMRDCVLNVVCGEIATKITWPSNFHPRTDAETDFACVVGVRNVYWITEHAPNEFTVAGWQETTGGNAQ